MKQCSDAMTSMARAGVWAVGLLGLALLSAPGARAALYGVDSGLDQLYRVDPATGAVTLVGSTSANGLTTPGGLAWGGSQMYVIDLEGGELFTLDLNTGTPTLIGGSGISGWQGLAARPSDGALFAVHQSGNLYSISATTGAATLIGEMGTGIRSALVFDGAGTLWTVEFSTGALGTVNTATGTVTAGATTISGLQGLTFSAGGTAYAVNTTTDSLYTINLSTVAATLVGAMTGTQFVKGLEFDAFPPSSEVPEPGSLALLGLGALGLGGMRLLRRSKN
jgi:sugar lactone lactonase YvrE